MASAHECLVLMLLYHSGCPSCTYLNLSSGELSRFFRAIWRAFGALQFFGAKWTRGYKPVCASFTAKDTATSVKNLIQLKIIQKPSDLVSKLENASET
jgi:hypothetical protein